MGFLALILLAFQMHVGGPTQMQDPTYPLRVRILQRSGSRTGYGAMRVWGRADLVDGTQEQGFDYESTCDVLFMVSHGDELYSARWKKPDKELEMLLSKMGTGKSDKCSVKADLKPFVYFRAADGTIDSRPMDHAAAPAAQTPGH